MPINPVRLGDTEVIRTSTINDNFSQVLSKDNTEAYMPTSSYHPATKKFVEDTIGNAGGGDMLKSEYDNNSDGVVNQADKVTNTFTVKFNEGGIEGTNKFVFDGSSAKTFHIKGGSNITLNEAAGTITITATDTVTTARYSKTPADVNLSNSAQSGNVVFGEAATKQISTVIPTSPTEEQKAFLPTVEAVKAHTDALLQASEAIRFIGTIEGGAVSTYGALTPAAKKGDKYIVSAEGKINGVEVEVNDSLLCVVDTAAATSENYTTIVNNWSITQGNINGAVVSDSTTVSPNTIPTFDGTNGRKIKSSGHTISASVPANAKFTDTTPNKISFTTEQWDSNAIDGVYHITLTITNGQNPINVFKLNSGSLYDMVVVDISVNGTAVTIGSHSKFIGYMVVI